MCKQLIELNIIIKEDGMKTTRRKFLQYTGVAAGASMLNTGIGWHEARVPTIAAVVPRAAFTWVTARMRPEVNIPVITTNRINTPQVAEDILARGDADMVSMARPTSASATPRVLPPSRISVSAISSLRSPISATRRFRTSTRL